MRGGFRTGATVRAAQATRTDLLLETVALCHQLGVLARSQRRFRPNDRLLWLLLRWLWPRWREALVLVQPATVDRWYREGVRRCWRRRARRPGRPRIDSSCRDLIRRMAAENCLWGAPRIHGELLKLGIAISERTVSRYLRGRPPRRSQTWRTFFANHLGDPTLTSPVMFADARGDASDVSFHATQLSINGAVSGHWAVDCGLPLQPTFLGMRLRQDHLQDRTAACKSTGRDPPPHPWLQLPRRPATVPSVCACEYLAHRLIDSGQTGVRGAASVEIALWDLIGKSANSSSCRTPSRSRAVAAPHVSHRARRERPGELRRERDLGDSTRLDSPRRSQSVPLSVAMPSFGSRRKVI
jgi:hypothetical protein